MITLPDFTKSFEYENSFYLSCDVSRITKFAAHYELYKQIGNLPGAIVECGVFKGVSLVRFAMFREIFENDTARKIIGFDTFAAFPDTDYLPDKAGRNKFMSEAGNESISVTQLQQVLSFKRLDQGVELVAGDITETVPAYVEKHPELKISLLNLDTDIYEPAVVILKYLFPKIVKGGILMVDDYGVFPGETSAVDSYFSGQDVKIQKFPFCQTPSFIIKE